jgi:RNA polymerase sigma-70 factor (ECF subfamily)
LPIWFRKRGTGRNLRKERPMTEIHKRIEAEIPRLRRYARALVRDVVGADDLVQECLTRALSKLDLWRDGTDLRAWLFTILHNQYVNHVRRSIRTGTPSEFDDDAPRLSQPANQEKRLELRDLDRALGQLSADQRTVILLVGLEGLPYAEVGAVLGIPVGTVRSRLSRGRLVLRELMGIDPVRHSVMEVRARRRGAAHLPASA